MGDIASITEFVRVDLTHFDLLDVPIFVAGESYGAAFYHHRLSPELMRDETATLKEVEGWAVADYAPAWQRRDTLNDAERKTVIAQLARYTGVNPSAIDAKLLMMTSPQFRSELLRDENVTLGRYDMRIKEHSATAGERESPVERNLLIARYLRIDLEFNTDLAYQGLEIGYSPAPEGRGASVGSRWIWNQAEASMTADQASADRARGPVSSTVGSGDGPPGGSQPWLRRAMTHNPLLRALVAAGQYDSLNSCTDNDYVVTHVEPQFRANLTARCYPAGHMMYDTRAARAALARDIAAFIADVNATPPPRR